MQPYPHHYCVHASGAREGEVALSAEGVASINSAPPAEFGGPGDRWSPENLLVASVVDCFVLTFRAIARASHLEWSKMECSGTGVLDRVERVTRFTEIALRVRLVLPEGTNSEQAERLLQKAEKSCLITNSLDLEPTLTTEIVSG